jgi:hypothetical protein
VLVHETAPPPDPQDGTGRIARLDQMEVVKPSRSRVADAAPRPHEVVDVAPPEPPTGERNVPALFCQFSQGAQTPFSEPGADRAAGLVLI